MPLAGWMLVKERDLGAPWLLLAAFCGALGNLLGSLLAYYVGAWGGRPLVLRYGRYLLISHHELDLADRWFNRYGNWTVFFSRLLPVVRTFISVPAGVARMPVWQFACTLRGLFPWSLGLACRLPAGGELGGSRLMRPADIPIALAWCYRSYVYRHVKRAWAEQPSKVEQ
jgi:membrane protein DedA with SNARE-associated domain